MVDINIFNLVGKLILDDSEYKKKIEEAKGENKKLLQEELKARQETAGKWAAVIAAVGAVVNIMKSLIYNTTEYAGSVKDLAQVYEQTYQTVQELNFVAQESGKNAEWVLRKAMNSGRSYAEILGLTNDEYAEMVAQAHELGLVMEDEVLDRADVLGEKLASLKYQWQSVLIGLLAGEEDAPANLEAFFERFIETAYRFLPMFSEFTVKLLTQVTIALVEYLPMLVADLSTAIVGDLIKNLPKTLWELVKAILETAINGLIWSTFGWVIDLFGGKKPQVDLGGGSSYSNELSFAPNDYEITERVDQNLLIEVRSEGVTANDKDVASSLEDLIDEKIGKMLGGI